MDQSGLTLPNRDYYLNKTDSDEILVAYLDYMTKVCLILAERFSTEKSKLRRIIHSMSGFNYTRWAYC